MVAAMGYSSHQKVFPIAPSVKAIGPRENLGKWGKKKDYQGKEMRKLTIATIIKQI
jgi:hypothetical protein